MLMIRYILPIVMGSSKWKEYSEIGIIQTINGQSSLSIIIHRNDVMCNWLCSPSCDCNKLFVFNHYFCQITHSQNEKSTQYWVTFRQTLIELWLVLMNCSSCLLHTVSSSLNALHQIHWTKPFTCLFKQSMPIQKFTLLQVVNCAFCHSVIKRKFNS